MTSFHHSGRAIFIGLISFCRAAKQLNAFVKLNAMALFLFGALSGAENKPILVINHYADQSRLSVLVWDGPVFAAYADGETIWRKNWANSLDAFFLARSDNAKQIAKKFSDLTTLYDGKIFTLTDSSDPERTVIWCDGRTISILGSWEKPRVFESHNPETVAMTESENNAEKALWLTLPEPLRNLLKETIKFDAAEAKTWRPAKIAVTLAPAGPKLGNPVIWPSNWPNSFVPASGSSTIKSIELPGEMLDEVLSLVALNGKPVAVLTGGETKSATVRFIFPGECFWKRAGE